jgi:hypothetical protein
MTLSCAHRDRPVDPFSPWRILVKPLRKLTRRTIGRTSAAFRIIHRAIVTAKTRRLERELMFHAGSSDDWSVTESVPEGRYPHRDAARFPQPPLVLGDKWEF